MNLVAKPARLSTVSGTFEQDFAQRLHWSAEQDAAIEERVASILADVQARGDAAVLEYTTRFDGLQADTMAALELTQAELKAAYDSLPAVMKLVKDLDLPQRGQSFLADYTMEVRVRLSLEQDFLERIEKLGNFIV